jgi:hypothetical protein
MSDQVELKDFSRKREPIEFMLNGVKLKAKTALGLTSMQRVIALKDRLGAATEDKLSVFEDIFAVLLHKDFVGAFSALVADEDDEPVDIAQLNDIMVYVMERQGLRPTQPSGKSSESSPAGEPGTPSTDGASPA